MTVICPTVTASTTEEYSRQLDLLSGFAKRIHVDYMDGVFTSSKSVSLNDMYFPEGIDIDLHLMAKDPEQLLEKIIDLKPHLVLIHYEARVNHLEFATSLKKHGIKAGLVILQKTEVEEIKDLISEFDEVLIFSGHLGYQGGVADMSMLSKAKEIHQMYPGFELAWDGGINEFNLNELVEGGINVLNVGKSITLSENPEDSYNKLMLKLS